MLKMENIHADRPALQQYEWPVVPEFTQFTPEFRIFLYASIEAKQTLLTTYPTPELKDKFLHESLSTCYAYIYGYPDSPCYLCSNPMLEIAMLGAKVILEEELIHSLPIIPVPHVRNQKDAVEYLRHFGVTNPCVNHSLFDYLDREVSLKGMTEFLWLETCRNEVVDDEVALLVCGLQGNMKKVMTSNLWDECGNGSLSRCHTYWLRRLIHKLDGWEVFLQYRGTRPWFATVTANTFNALLTRPGYKFRAYGCFMATESWVAPHFDHIISGLARLGLDHDDVAAYFLAHQRIDPRHTLEIIEALLHQTPEASAIQLQEIVHGAHLAVAAGMSQYERLLNHFRSTTSDQGV